jgi:hypothetical protein
MRIWRDKEPRELRKLLRDWKELADARIQGKDVEMCDKCGDTYYRDEMREAPSLLGTKWFCLRCVLESN